MAFLVSTAIIASLIMTEFQAAAVVAFMMMLKEFLENITITRVEKSIAG